MPPRNYAYHYDDDKNYDDHTNQIRAPTRFSGRYIRRCDGSTWRNAEVVDNDSGGSLDKATKGSWRRPTNCPSPKPRSMSPRQCNRKAAQEMRSGEQSSKSSTGNKANGVATEENQRPYSVTAAVEAAWKTFIRSMKPHFIQE